MTGTPHLPLLRQDLRLLPGGTGPGGAPTWLLWDQPRNQFFRLGWPEFEMVARWGEATGPQDLLDRVHRETTLTISEERLILLVHFLTVQGLTQPSSVDVAQRMQPVGWFTKLLHHYLFFRIPLARPDAFLHTLVPVVTLLTHWSFLLVTGLALLLGGFLTLRQWDAFVGSLNGMTTPAGVATLFVTLLSAKLVHELGHALVAKRLGCRIPAMGVAFLVMWPLLYTDTNETWRLTRKKDRFKVALAGVAAESLLAIWALLAWALVEEGPWRGALFSLVAVVWTGTLLLNINPFMRFDGYFMLSDALDMPNLHERSFAMGKWFIRKVLLGATLPPPERWSRGMRSFLIGFALITWVYRFFLYLGIALLVYHLFFKWLGAFLMGVELYWFLLGPIVREWSWWFSNRREMAAGHVRLWMLMSVLAGMVFFLPWQSAITMPAVWRCSVYAGVFPPMGGVIETLKVTGGQRVAQGDPLLSMAAPELNWRLTQSRLEEVRFREELLLYGPKFFANRLVAEQKRVAAQVQMAGLLAQRERLVIRAPVSGTVTLIKEGLTPGLWVGKEDALLEIRQFGSERVFAYVAEKDRSQVIPGSRGAFYPDHANYPVMEVQWVDSDPFAVAKLEDLKLASLYGGPIEAERMERDTLRPIQPHFIIRFQRTGAGEGSSIAQSIPGTVIVRGEPDTLAGRVWKNVAALWVRETGW
ncbi:MAG: biotin/lipoyl-binding protein [Magnetococcales bacterium]|nr:biotin/lipoyl-binding protein [Magnetococcales bacterium]